MTAAAQQVLNSLPTLRAPLRYLCLQRGHRTLFEGTSAYNAYICLAHARSRVPVSAPYLLKGRRGAVHLLPLPWAQGVRLTAMHGLRRLRS
jgi:hypothetical protein